MEEMALSWQILSPCYRGGRTVLAQVDGGERDSLSRGRHSPGVGYCYSRALIRSAARSPIMMVVALVLALMTLGIIEASTTP